MRVALYVRVSTQEQKAAIQIDALRAYVEARGDQVVQVYRDDGESGAKASRPALDRLSQDILRGPGIDAVAIVKLDRLARSVSHLITYSRFLEENGVDLIVKDQGFDTTTPAGKLLFHMLAAIAEFERDLISERTKAGLEHARANGSVLGRPPKESEAMNAAMKRALERGVSVRQAAREYDVPEASLRRRVKSLKQGISLGVAKLPKKLPKVA